MTYSAQNGPVSASMLAGDPNELANALVAYRAADAAEVLNGLGRSVAAQVLEAMPVSAAVQILNEPHLDEPAKLIELLPVDCAAAILTGLHPDRRADIFRELSEGPRRALLPRLDKHSREILEQLLNYPPQSAGGLMTTDFVSVPADWTVEQTLKHIHDVARSGEPVYAVCLLDPATQRLVKVVGLSGLITGDPKAVVLSLARPHDPIAVPPLTDREEVARLLSKY
ncbi:MAG: magnesium transporter, partial [Rhodomicrobiaceae bacterium]